MSIPPTPDRLTVTIQMLMSALTMVAREAELTPAQRRLIDSALRLATEVVHYEGEKL